MRIVVQQSRPGSGPRRCSAGGRRPPLVRSAAHPDAARPCRPEDAQVQVRTEIQRAEQFASVAESATRAVVTLRAAYAAISSLAPRCSDREDRESSSLSRLAVAALRVRRGIDEARAERRPRTDGRLIHGEDAIARPSIRCDGLRTERAPALVLLQRLVRDPIAAWSSSPTWRAARGRALAHEPRARRHVLVAPASSAPCGSSAPPSSSRATA